MGHLAGGVHPASVRPATVRAIGKRSNVPARARAPPGRCAVPAGQPIRRGRCRRSGVELVAPAVPGGGDGLLRGYVNHHDRPVLGMTNELIRLGGT